MRQTGEIRSEADAQILTGIWFLSCLDDNPGMFYHSVARRLNTDEQNIRTKVEEWRELFRPGVNHNDTDQRLKDLTSELTNIADLTKKERAEAKNNSVSQETWNRRCFRSQFRRELRAGKSTPDEIKIGLDYIESRRKTYLEYAAERRQRKTYLAPILAIVVTLAVGALAAVGNIVVGMESNDLKKKELIMKDREMVSKEQGVIKPSSPAPTSPPTR